MNISEIDQLRETYRNWVDDAIMRGDIKRQPQWTGSIAVGDKLYVEKLKDQMGYKAIGRKVLENGDSFVLKEPQASYRSLSNRAVRNQTEDNTIYWKNASENYLNPDMSLEGSY